MIFAKMDNGRLRFCPQTGKDGQGRTHTDLPKYYETAQDRDGWLEYVPTDPPRDAAEPVYTTQNGRLIQSWTAVNVPPEPTQAEQVDLPEEAVPESIEGGLLWQ